MIPGWISPIAIPLKMPTDLSHIDSDFCWCDPILEFDENGEIIVIHREVAWN